MRLEALRIRRLPGLGDPLELERLRPGINVVTGPNASGKSSLVRTLRYLLTDPERDDPLDLALEAEFVDGDHRWRVIRSGSGVEWRRDGVRMEAPSLPDRRFLHCYWLTVEDLLGVGHAADDELVARLRRELTGGYDVSALLGGDGPFRVGARHGGTQAKTLRETRGKVGTVMKEYRGLQEERERLDELEQRIGARDGIGTDMATVDRALELLEARRARVEAEAALAAFPAPREAMALLRGDERARLEELEQRRRTLARETDDLRRDEAAARAALRDSGLQEGGPDEEELEHYRDLVDGAKELLSARRTAEQARGRAVAWEAEALGRLGTPEGTTPSLDPATISEAGKLAAEVERVRGRVRELEARVEDVPSAPPAAALEAHREGAAALRSWLAAAATGLGRVWLPASLVVVAALLAAGGMLASREGVALAGVLLAALAGLAALAAAWTAQQERGSARSRFLATGLKAPPEWTASGVSSCLEEVEGELVELRAREHRARRVEGDRERLAEARAELARWEARKEELAGRVGFDPGSTAASFHQFVALVDDVGQARREVGEADEQIARLDAGLSERVDAIQSFLARWGEAPDGAQEPPGSGLTVGAMETAVRRLRRRAGTAREARNTIEGVARGLGRALRDLDVVDGDVKALYGSVGLEPEQRRLLEERLEVLQEFRTRDEVLRESSVRESTLRSRLGEDEELLARVDADDEAGLRSIRERLKAREQEVTALRDERTAILTRLDQAGSDRKLEEARAREAEARDTLDEALDDALFAEAGAFLLEEVLEEHRTEHEPRVLQEAREWFQRFTHHRWSLELTEDAGLAARDLALREPRSLSELSSGTRMQLLLAVRVAWARNLEEGRGSLPFFLDEALTTSDPARFARVVECLAQLATEEDRQIFYLSAQPGDLVLWERAMGRAPNVVDLTEVRSGTPWDERVGPFILPESTPVPHPDGDRAEAYAPRLGVPPVNPWKEAGGIHLFHLLRDDLERLHTLMAEWGLECQGQLEALMADPAGELAVPELEVRRRLEGRCSVAAIWVDAWRTGRGKPVGRGVLERSGAVSENFIEEVAALAEEVGGDPGELIAALPDVPRFRANKVDELARWLEEDGHLPPGEPLSQGEREARVLREGAGILPPGEIREVVRWLEAGLGEGRNPRYRS